MTVAVLSSFAWRRLFGRRTAALVVHIGVPPCVVQAMMFGVAGNFHGTYEALMLQFDYFVNGQDLDLGSEDYASQPLMYLLLYSVTSIVLFLLLSQVRA